MDDGQKDRWEEDNGDHGEHSDERGEEANSSHDQQVSTYGRNRSIYVKSDPKLSHPQTFTIKEAKDVLGGQEEVLDQFRMTVHARRMEDDQHKTYCSLPLGVYACASACIDQTISSEHALRCLVSCQVN